MIPLSNTTLPLYKVKLFVNIHANYDLYEIFNDVLNYKTNFVTAVFVIKVDILLNLDTFEYIFI